VPEPGQIENRAAAGYLRELLLKPGRYLDLWQRRVSNAKTGLINQMAVSEVIAEWLQSSDRRVDRTVAPYQLRDLVDGALTGNVMSDQSLQLFIDAFAFSEHEAQRLRHLRAGSRRIRVLSGSHAMPAEAEGDVDREFGKRRHRTISMHDHVHVGYDRRIERARTIQVIEAIAPNVDRIPFLADTNVLTLEVGQGGRALTDEVRQIGDEVFLTEILLARSLDTGDTSTLEYLITYRFPGNLTDPGECEFRRAVIRQIDNFNIRVEFHPECLPAAVWWARWDGVEGAVVEREAVSLDREYSAHRYLSFLEATVVGFYWQWELEHVESRLATDSTRGDGRS